MTAVASSLFDMSATPVLANGIGSTGPQATTMFGALLAAAPSNGIVPAAALPGEATKLPAPNIAALLASTTDLASASPAATPAAIAAATPAMIATPQNPVMGSASLSPVPADEADGPPPATTIAVARASGPQATPRPADAVVSPVISPAPVAIEDEHRPDKAHGATLVTQAPDSPTTLVIPPPTVTEAPAASPAAVAPTAGAERPKIARHHSDPANLPAPSDTSAPAPAAAPLPAVIAAPVATPHTAAAAADPPEPAPEAEDVGRGDAQAADAPAPFGTPVLALHSTLANGAGIVVPPPPVVAMAAARPATEPAAKLRTIGASAAPDLRNQAAGEPLSAAADQPMAPTGDGRSDAPSGGGGDPSSSHQATAPIDRATTAPAPRDGASAFAPPIAQPPATAATHATQGAPAAITAQPGRIGQELGVAIAHHVAGGGAIGGGDLITLRLNPIDMGRIEVRLSFDDGGTLRAVVSADNPVALDMLRRDSAELGRALADAGVRADTQTLRFDTRAGTGQSGGNPGQPWQRQPEPSDDASSDAHTDIPDPITATYRPLRTRGRIDMVA